MCYVPAFQKTHPTIKTRSVHDTKPAVLVLNMTQSKLISRLLFPHSIYFMKHPARRLYVKRNLTSSARLQQRAGTVAQWSCKECTDYIIALDTWTSVHPVYYTVPLNLDNGSWHDNARLGIMKPTIMAIHWCRLENIKLSHVVHVVCVSRSCNLHVLSI